MVKRSSFLLVLLLAVIFCISPKKADAICSNPNTTTMLLQSINWQSFAAIYFAGATVEASSDTTQDINDTIGGQSAICTCGVPPLVRVGIPFGMWEPARLIERVHDPFCFYVFDLDVGSSYTYKKGTTKQPSGAVSNSQHNFAHAHYVIYPVMAILEIGLDVTCFEVVGIDIGYMTEVDPLWKSDTLTSILSPESLLFANVFSTVACVPSVITDAIGFAYPGRWFFWCQGAVGPVYPVTGNHIHDQMVDNVVGTAGKMLFKLVRQIMIWDPAIYVCYPIPIMTWMKDHFKIHISEYFQCPITNTLGRPSIIHGAFQNMPTKENYVFVVFRKRHCCMM